MRVRRGGRAVWMAGVVIVAAAVLAGCGATRSGAGRATPGPAGTSSVPASGAGESTTGAAMWFVSLRMVSPDIGWALRWTRNPGAASAGVLALARTDDGGRAWDDVTPPGARPLLTPAATGTLFALGAKRAWFAVSEMGAHRSPRIVVFATGDGGRTWRASPAFGSLGLPRVLYFTGPEHGWLVAEEGAAMGSDAVAVFATADGGIRWSLVARTPPLAGPGRGAGGLPLRCDKTGIAFTGAATGWITGDCAGAPMVEVTHDGGRTWAPQPLAAQLGACSQGSQADPPQFFGAVGYLTVSCYPRAALLVSHDGGATWSRVTLPAKAGVYPRIEFVDARHGVLIPAGPQAVLGKLVYRTFDGGQAWQAVHPRTRSGLPGTMVDFVTSATGFAWTPGADATSRTPPPLCRTRDDGRTWACFAPHVMTTRHPG